MPTFPLEFDVIDAFTSQPFAGNPAAVVCLENELRTLDDAHLQLIAREVNLSETAFLWPESPKGCYRLRWFTPLVEVPICGHATLASAYVLFARDPALHHITFTNPFAGDLRASRISAPDGELYELDFPIDRKLGQVEHEELNLVKKAWLAAAPALRDNDIVQIMRTGHGFLVEVNMPEQERLGKLLVNASHLAQLQGIMQLLTCPAPAGSPHDFHSRCFCPAVGIPEDPVTGSSFLSLAPYWKMKIAGKGSPPAPLLAYQASTRGGEVQLVVGSDRVYLRGHAVPVSHGTMRF